MPRCFSVEGMPYKMKIQLHHFSLEITPDVSASFSVRLIIRKVITALLWNLSY